MSKNKKVKPKLNTVYIRGMEYTLGSKTKCKNDIVTLEKQLTAQNQRYKTYNGCDKGISVDKIISELKDQVNLWTTIYLDAHGGRNNNKHSILLSSKSALTSQVLGLFSSINKPLRIELFGCYSGKAIDSITFMPVGSSLVTHSSASMGSELSLNMEELFHSIRQDTHNPFSNYAVTILLSSEQVNALSVRTRTGIEIFSTSLSVANCSKKEIGLWQESQILKLKKFYEELIGKALPVEVTQQISEAIAFIEEHKTIKRIQQEYIVRIQELNLISASMNDDVDRIGCLLAEDLDINARAIDSNTAICIASERGHVSVVEKLIEAKADVDIVTYDGSTPIHIALDKGHTSIVERLIRVGADVNSATYEGYTPVYIASQKGYVLIVEQLIRAGADVNSATHKGYTPVYIASQMGYVSVVEQLIEAKADVNRAAITDDSTPIYIALFKEHVSVAEQLIRAGADVNRAAYNGITPLQIASYNGNVSVVEQLIKAGANVNEARSSGMPIKVACAAKFYDIVKLLLKHNAHTDTLSESCILKFMPDLYEMVEVGKLHAAHEDL